MCLYTGLLNIEPMVYFDTHNICFSKNVSVLCIVFFYVFVMYLKCEN